MRSHDKLPEGMEETLKTTLLLIIHKFLRVYPLIMSSIKIKSMPVVKTSEQSCRQCIKVKIEEILDGICKCHDVVIFLSIGNVVSRTIFKPKRFDLCAAVEITVARQRERWWRVEWINGMLSLLAPMLFFFLNCISYSTRRLSFLFLYNLSLQHFSTFYKAVHRFNITHPIDIHLIFNLSL